jgi:hypothetical protein
MVKAYAEWLVIEGIPGLFIIIRGHCFFHMTQEVLQVTLFNIHLKVPAQLVEVINADAITDTIEADVIDNATHK